MKLITILTLVAALTDLRYAGERAACSAKQDSIPNKQRYSFRLLSSADQPAKKRLTTLTIYPAKVRSTNEISLPIEFNERTVKIRLGDTLLQEDEDYVFIRATNRIRILDETALKSERPIMITYELLNWK